MDERLSSFFDGMPDRYRDAVADVVEYATGRETEHPEHLFFVLAFAFMEIVKAYERKTGERVADVVKVTPSPGNETVN